MLRARRLRPLAVVALTVGGLVATAGLQGACARSDTEPVSEQTALVPPDGGVVFDNLCADTTCPSPWATCEGSSVPCGTDTSHDVDHCGACGARCKTTPSQKHASSVCTGGKCSIACKGLFADCNGDPSDGCEVPIEGDPKNCGACNNACSDGVLCWRGACGCPNGFVVCGTECVDVSSDNSNCGACGEVCRAPTNGADPRWTCGPNVTPANTMWSCGSGECKMRCDGEHDDCNHDLCLDGCETNITNDRNNCGGCGRVCPAGQGCVDGACICPPGLQRCGRQCVDLDNDPNNCGACGEFCPGPSSFGNAVPSGGPQCKAGKCSYVCFPGFADCNGSVDDGCEVDLMKDPAHCGSCETKCGRGPKQPCVGGHCLTRECDGGVVVF